MKRILFLGFLLLCSGPAARPQERWDPKDPNRIGSCINISHKLSSALSTGSIVNGEITIWTLDEVRLVARVKEQIVNGRKTRVRTSWGVVDLAGNPVTFDENTRLRERGGKMLDQRLVYTRGTNPEGCFVVEQKERS